MCCAIIRAVWASLWKKLNDLPPPHSRLMWCYRFDFFAFPLLAVTIAALTCRSVAWVAWAAFGVVLFTFVEYWTHRLLLHRLLWHGMHERHHTHPSERVIFPLWYTPSIFAAFFVVLPTPVFAGFVLGYVWFLVWHHTLHHVDLSKRPWPRAYARWHDVHHQGKPKNYGITHPVWDYLFGTYQKANLKVARF